MAESAILRREKAIYRARLRRLRAAREEESRAYLAHGRESPEQVAAARKVESRKAAMLRAARSVGAVERSELGKASPEIELAAEAGVEDDPRRNPGTEHRVRAYSREDGEHVRPHLARNPRRRR